MDTTVEIVSEPITVNTETNPVQVFAGSTAFNTVAWGNITGTLSNQTDLVAALNLRNLKSANLSDVGDAAVAFGNIKQQATTSSTGVVELATDGESAANLAVQANDSRLVALASSVRYVSTPPANQNDFTGLPGGVVPTSGLYVSAATNVLWVIWPGQAQWWHADLSLF